MKTIILSVLLSFVSLFGVTLSNNVMVKAQSDSSTCVTNENYTSVVDDLIKLDKYSDEIISSGENQFITLTQAYDSDNTLKTYVYLNYLGDTDDNLLVNINTNFEFDNTRLRNLDLISYDTNSFLKKYEVKNLDNLDISTRKYEVGSFCLSNDGGSLTHIIDFDVKPIYYFNGTSNENLECYNQEIETIIITDKQVAMYCYGDSLNYFGKETGLMGNSNIYTDAWFVFFNTDKQIDNLISIKLSYVQYNFCVGAYGGNTYMDYIFTETYVNDFVNNVPSAYSGSAYSGDFYINYDETKTITIEPGTKKVEETQYGWFGSHKTTYEILDNIMDLRKYKAQNEDTFVFTEYANTYTWGVHFNDTTKSFKQKGSNQAAGLITASGVTDTTILSLTFETDHEEKTLLAIDTPSDSEDNQGNIAETPKKDDLGYDDDKWEKIKEMLLMILRIMLIVPALIVIYYICKIIFSVISMLLKKTQKKYKKKGR